MGGPPGLAPAKCSPQALPAPPQSPTSSLAFPPHSHAQACRAQLTHAAHPSLMVPLPKHTSSPSPQQGPHSGEHDASLHSRSVGQSPSTGAFCKGKGTGAQTAAAQSGGHQAQHVRHAAASVSRSARLPRKPTAGSSWQAVQQKPAGQGMGHRQPHVQAGRRPTQAYAAAQCSRLAGSGALTDSSTGAIGLTGMIEHHRTPGRRYPTWMQ